MTNSECPAFPFSHRPGIAMDPDYLKQMRIQPRYLYDYRTVTLPSW